MQTQLHVLALSASPAPRRPPQLQSDILYIQLFAAILATDHKKRQNKSFNKMSNNLVTVPTMRVIWPEAV
jgi:hypothetical protein